MYNPYNRAIVADSKYSECLVGVAMTNNVLYILYTRLYFN